MRNWRLFLSVLLGAALTAVPAYADPVSDIIAAVATLASTAAATVTSTTFLISTALSVGLSYVAKALAGKPKQSVGGSSGKLQAGGTQPRTFIIGRGMTGGQLVYANTWGDKTPNANLVMVIKLQDLPASGLAEFWVADQKVTYDTGGTPTDWGYPVPEYNQGGKDYLWIKFYDGTQTAADSFLVTKFGSDPNYPYQSTRVGQGCAYAIVTARVNEQLFSGFPQYKFVLDGVKLYDPRADSTVGGSGSQRWPDQSTWAHTDNPKVIEYNILRGISYNGDWFYGLQSLSASQLPLDSWFAAMNECDASVATAAGGTEAQFRCGGEISVDTQPADLIDELNKACNGRTAEVGGIYKTHVGAAGSATISWTDADIITTVQQTHDQFPSLNDTINGITASYPEPAEGWNSKDAPPRYDSDLETEDGGRRLTSDIQYNLVPYGEQVQRLMKAALAEARRFRKHSMVLPPSAFATEPLDFGSWTSDRNGYSDKLFRFETVTDGDNLDIGIAIVEVDPSDYDWDPDTDFKEHADGTLTIARPAPQALTGWSLTGVAVDGDNGLQIPGLELQWDTDDLDDVNGVQYQIRLTSTGAIVLEGQTDSWQSGVGVITQNIVRNTAYQGRARYRSASDRDFDWTDWLDATTPDVRISALDIYNQAIGFEQFRQDVADMQAFIGSQVRGLIDEIQTLTQGSSEGLLGAFSDVQTLRTELHSVTNDLTASYTNAISVATGPFASAADSITELSASYGGDSLSDIVIGLDARVTANEGSIASSASAITALTSTVGNFSASGLFRVSTNASLNGASATVAIAAAATSGGAAATAALYLSAMSDGTSQIIASANKFYMTDGTNYDYPFLFSNGTLFVKSAVIPNLTADKITSGTLNVGNLTVTGTLTASNLSTSAASKRNILQMTGSNIPTSQTLLATLNLTGCTTTDPVDLKISGTYTHSGGATGFKIFLKPTHTWLIDTAKVDESGTADGTSKPYCKVIDFTNDVNNKGLFNLAFTDIPTTSSPSWAIYGQGVGGSVSYLGLASVVQTYR